MHICWDTPSENTGLCAFNSSAILHCGIVRMLFITLLTHKPRNAWFRKTNCFFFAAVDKELPEPLTLGTTSSCQPLFNPVQQHLKLLCSMKSLSFLKGYMYFFLTKNTMIRVLFQNVHRFALNLQGLTIMIVESFPSNTLLTEVV